MYGLHFINQFWLLCLLMCWPILSLHAQGVYFELCRGEKDRPPHLENKEDPNTLGISTVLLALLCPSDSMGKGPLRCNCFLPPQITLCPHQVNHTELCILADWLFAAYRIQSKVLCLASEPSAIWSHPTYLLHCPLRTICSTTTRLSLLR